MKMIQLKKGKFYLKLDEVFYVEKNKRIPYGSVSHIKGFRLNRNSAEFFQKEIDKKTFVCREITKEEFLEGKEKALKIINKIFKKL